MQYKSFVLALLFAAAFTDCGSGKEEPKTESAKSLSATSTDKNTRAAFPFDLSKPAATWTLPDELLEISGNAWIDDNHLLVIEDMNPLLYVLRLDKNATIEKKIPFAKDKGKKFDIEDVALQGTTAYALWSHGRVYKIENWQTKPAVTKLETDLDKSNNTEGLCFDPETKQLLIACKNDSGEKGEKKSTRSIYQMDPATGKMKSEPFLLIEKKDFKKVEDEKFDFYPSAVAVHPTTGDIFVLSTKDTKGLAQYSHDGTLKAFEWIDKDLMPQPEGLCFSPNGTLYISTEGKHGQPAKVLKFNAAK
jgi:uncharacterized protein YjiK